MPDVKMNYQMMEDMGRTCSDAAKQLEDVMSSIGGIGSTLQDAFQGKAGDSMQQALNQTLKQKLQNFVDEMKEMASNLQQAAQDTRDGITNSKSKYGG
jgi:WXG100 family type VII secretion target